MSKKLTQKQKETQALIMAETAIAEVIKELKKVTALKILRVEVIDEEGFFQVEIVYVNVR